MASKTANRSTANQARRDRNRARNSAQNAANVVALTEMGITDNYPRPSKLVRRQHRAYDGRVQARAQVHADREARGKARAADKQARAARQATAATNREAMSATLRDVAASIGKHE